MDLYGGLGRSIPKHHRSPALAREIAQIRDELAIVKHSVRAVELEDGRTVLSFTLKTDEIGEPANQILDREPVSLVYPQGGVGVKGPAVYSDREDFPRDLTHLNPVSEGSPASICLAREGHGALYEREGVSGIIRQLSRWMRDAKSDALNRGGWEPVPTGEARYVGVLHSAPFQELANRANAGPGWATCLAILGDGSVLAMHDGLAVGGPGTANRLQQLLNHVKPMLRGLRGIPTVFLWQGPEREESKPGFGPCSRGPELIGVLDSFGLRDAFFMAMEGVLSPERSFPEAVFLLIGVRRPYPMMDEIFGLSTDRRARSVELRGYLVRPGASGEVVEDSSEVADVVLDQLPTPALFSDVSALSPSRPAFFVGYGALGSEIGELVARAGVGCAGVLDADRVRSHNLARHKAMAHEIGMEKASVHLRISAGINPFERDSFLAERVDVVDLAVDQLRERVPLDAIIIDSTASDAVRRVLARCPGLPRVVRGEIYGAGRLGAQSLEARDRNPDVLDLYYYFCALSASDEDVAAVLRAEAVIRGGPETYTAGFGCSSATVRMPQWKIAAHAAAFLPAIARLAEGDDLSPGIGLNLLHPDGHPAGWRWMAASTFRVEPDPRGWEVRIGPGVERRMVALMSEATPTETGGYLYGGVDANLRRITVVLATAPPSGTVASSVHLNLPPAGRSEEERLIRLNSGRRLVPVGSWHSHPRGSVRMSERDARTAEQFRRENANRGLPTLLFVISPNGIGTHILL